MSTYQNVVGHVFERTVQFTNDIYVDELAENHFLSQFFVTYLSHLPKAVDYCRQFQSGTTFNILLYCTHGSGWCRIGDHLQVIHPNQYILIPATDLEVEYGSAKDDVWGVYITQFNGHNLAAFNDSFEISSRVVPLDVGVNTKGLEIWEEMYRLLNQAPSNSNYMHANFCLYHFLGSFLFAEDPAGRNKDDSWVSETISFMHDMIHEKLSVEDLADRLHLSASYFSALFRKATGLAPLEYFIQIKLQNACHLLKEKGLKVKDVAGAIGYDDPFHFSRLFKKHMRVSPAAYKLSARNSAKQVPEALKVGIGNKQALVVG